jgi:hypothetical protein
MGFELGLSLHKAKDETLVEKKDTERKFRRVREDVNSEWRKFDVAELQ